MTQSILSDRFERIYLDGGKELTSHLKLRQKMSLNENGRVEL